MCFNYSIVKFQEYLEKRFQAKFDNTSQNFRPVYLISAFNIPFAPVICSDESDKIKMIKWGLIPFWVKDQKYADKIRNSTFNARSDTVFEKPSFKNAVAKKRCLVLADGFFEWHEHDGKKFPFYIRFKNKEAFTFAGLWEEWKNPSNEETVRTFSIITTDANELLKKIHNVKMRMPVILNKENEKKWISGISKDEIIQLMKPYTGDDMEAYTVSKAIIQKNTDIFSEEIIKEFKYENLEKF